MATPCPKCGAAKTESVQHGLMDEVAKKFGYRLRKCSRCRKYRLLPRHRRPDDAPADAAKPQEQEEVFVCPGCGAKDFRRSRRRWWDYFLFHGPMLRCRICRQRVEAPLEEN